MTDAIPLPADYGTRPRHHVVYECQGGGRILYIGASSSVGERVSEHRRKAPWWPEVEQVFIRIMPTRAEAFAAERAAILAVQPPYNTRHTPRYAEPLRRST